jgi:hypothetical protein
MNTSVYSLPMNGSAVAVAIAHSLAWPTAIVLAVVLMRRELAGTVERIQSVEFPGGKATFAALGDYEKMIAAATTDEAPAELGTGVRHRAAEFTVLEALADAVPRQAVIDAWGLLEYQLNAASDRITPDQPHGWPQVARNLEAWGKWPAVYPAVQELRRLRDYTVRSNRSPSSSDAARYVSVVEELVTTIRTSVPSEVGSGGEE